MHTLQTSDRIRQLNLDLGPRKEWEHSALRQFLRRRTLLKSAAVHVAIQFRISLTDYWTPFPIKLVIYPIAIWEGVLIGAKVI